LSVCLCLSVLSSLAVYFPLCLSLTSLCPSACLHLSLPVSLSPSPSIYPHQPHLTLSLTLSFSLPYLSHTHTPPPTHTHTLSYFQSSPIPVLKVVHIRDRGYVLLFLQARGGQLLFLMQGRVRLQGEGYSNIRLVVGCCTPLRQSESVLRDNRETELQRALDLEI